MSISAISRYFGISTSSPTQPPTDIQQQVNQNLAYIVNASKSLPSLNSSPHTTLSALAENWIELKQAVSQYPDYYGTSGPYSIENPSPTSLLVTGPNNLQLFLNTMQHSTVYMPSPSKDGNGKCTLYDLSLTSPSLFSPNLLELLDQTEVDSDHVYGWTCHFNQGAPNGNSSSIGDSDFLAAWKNAPFINLADPIGVNLPALTSAMQNKSMAPDQIQTALQSYYTHFYNLPENDKFPGSQFPGYAETTSFYYHNWYVIGGLDSMFGVGSAYNVVAYGKISNILDSLKVS
jgi:hypothetical protein